MRVFLLKMYLDNRFGEFKEQLNVLKYELVGSSTSNVVNEMRSYCIL